MGCDIHLIVEMQDDAGTWRAIPRPVDLIGKYDATPDRQECERYQQTCKVLGITPPYRVADYVQDGTLDLRAWRDSGHPLAIAEWRNYCVFAILADVRSRYNILSIAQPRGVPGDASSDYLAPVERWRRNGHSHSYHMLSQLLGYNWQHVTAHSGLVNCVEYTKWIASGRKERGEGPNSWCSGAGGYNVRIVPEQEMVQFVTTFGLRDIKTPDGKIWYARIEWRETAATSAGEFYSKFIPWLNGLGKDPDGVRIVFFFDN
jgi:hypothetical protein